MTRLQWRTIYKLMVNKMSSSSRSWIAFFTAVLLAIYIGHIPFHLSVEEHTHGPVAVESDAHPHHEHDAEHHSHPKTDHSAVFVSKSKLSILHVDFVVSETAVLWEVPVFLRVSFLETFDLPGRSPPNRFVARGPPSV